MPKGHKSNGSYIGSSSASFSTGGKFDKQTQGNFRASNTWGYSFDGLYLNFDALNAQSYSGTGTVMTSVGGKSDGSEAYLNLGGTRSYSSNGHFIMENTSYFDVAAITPATNNFTYELWARPRATHEIDSETNGGAAGVGGQKYIIGAGHQGDLGGGAGISCGTNGISVYEHGSGYMPPLLVWSGNVSSTAFTHIVVTYTNRIPKLYVNGTFIKTGVVSARATSVQGGYNIGYGSYGAFTGDWAIARYYNRTISDSEITQNFTSLRGRFGV
jgi:hypothetical protein